MIKHILYSIVILILVSCQEIITFETSDQDEVIVVDGYLSDMSFNDMRSAEGNGRYFTVNVRMGRPVNTYTPQPLENAQVTLEIDDGSAIELTPMDEGQFSICDPDFKASPSHEYRLVVTTETEVITSQWVKTPSHENQFGELKQSVQTRKAYDATLEESLDELTLVYSSKLENTILDQAQYYTWDFKAAWIYISPLASPGSPYRKCYIESEYYLNHFPLAIHSGQPRYQELVDIPLNNGRLEHEFSIFAIQKAVSRDFFSYLNGIKEQTNRGSIFDSPPYNLPTNISSNVGSKTAGFFAVIKESAQRWYTNLGDLGYGNEWEYGMECFPPMPPPPNWCADCRNYRGASGATVVKPNWWR